jgi:sugar/nucleoside kinase (ribokinase family)
MLLNDLIDLQEKLKKLKMTVLPDFFLDVLVNPNMSYEELMQGINLTFSRGGGNFLGPEVSFVEGGNGGNVAKTLAGLGIPTTFIAESSTLGKELIEFYFHPLGIRTQISTKGTLASSVIFEIPSEKGTNNVMLSSTGSLTNYGANKLTKDQWDILKDSDVVAITNAQNLHMEDLVENILGNIPASTSVSIDFSDLTPHLHRIDGIIERIFDHSNPPEIIVGNEIEICQLAKEQLDRPDKAIKLLSASYPSILFGLHMAHKAEIWKNNELLAEEPCFKVQVQKTTGAGDNWHAGLIIGWKLGFPMEQTAEFANAVAAYQISTAKIGSLEDIISFIKSTEKHS